MFRLVAALLVYLMAAGVLAQPGVWVLCVAGGGHVELEQVTALGPSCEALPAAAAADDPGCSEICGDCRDVTVASDASLHAKRTLAPLGAKALPACAGWDRTPVLSDLSVHEFGSVLLSHQGTRPPLDSIVFRC